MKNQTVLQSKRLELFNCTADINLQTAVQQMVKDDVSCLVVVDERGDLIGLITRIDLVKVCLENDNWTQELVGDHMVTDVITAPPDMTLGEVGEILLAHHIHRVVIVREEDGRRIPIAIVSAADLVYHMARE
jgi:DeoR family transcriptional regulator, catabolite repression regulator